MRHENDTDNEDIQVDGSRNTATTGDSIMRVYRTDDYLPPNKTWVLAHRVGTNWHSTATNPEGCYWKVVCFERGITVEERDAMPECPRKHEHHAGDVGFNNEKPYYWWEFGPGSHFGQDIDLWCYLPGELR